MHFELCNCEPNPVLNQEYDPKTFSEHHSNVPLTVYFLISNSQLSACQTICSIVVLKV